MTLKRSIKLWAISTGEKPAPLAGFLGQGWFLNMNSLLSYGDLWQLYRDQGITTATFRTRKLAEAALAKKRTSILSAFPKAKVVRIFVYILTQDLPR